MDRKNVPFGQKINNTDTEKLLTLILSAPEYLQKNNEMQFKTDPNTGHKQQKRASENKKSGD